MRRAQPRLRLGMILFAVLTMGLVAACGTLEPSRSGSSGTGTDVRNEAPTFSLTGVEGRSVSLADLRSQERPFVLYFFATWCSTCRAELERLKAIYPAYADDVAFIAVSIDPGESPDLLEAYRADRGYPWDVFVFDQDILTAYQVTSTATKLAVNSEGVITMRAGFGVRSANAWEQTFRELLES